MIPKSSFAGELWPEGSLRVHQVAGQAGQGTAPPALLPPITDAPQGLGPVPVAQRSGMALCLSGGGYRAALFHLGAVRRLNELGILSQIDTVTSVSGGSIIAAILAAGIGSRWPSPRTAYPELERDVERSLRNLCRMNIRTLPILKGMLPWNWPNSAVPIRSMIERYKREITDMQLSQLPEHPRFVLCATDMTYGVNWIFSRDKVGSYRAGHLVPQGERFSVATAVGASSCFPPVFDPLPIGVDPAELSGGDDPPGPARDARIRGLGLADGGLYDNMGLEPVWKRHRFLLVSEGGSTFDAQGDAGFFWRLNRYVEVMGNQVGSLRRRWLMASFKQSNPDDPEADPDRGLAGTYWGIGATTAAYEVPTPGYSAALVDEVISEVRTDLDAFSDAEMEVLMNHGYTLAAAAAEKWLRPFGLIAIDAPVVLPFPDRMDENGVRKALANSHRRKFPFGRR